MGRLTTSERESFQEPVYILDSSNPIGMRDRLARFLGVQLIYLSVGVLIYGIFLAIRPEAANLFVTFVYTLCLCNLTTFAMGRFGFLYGGRRPLRYWLLYVGLLLALTPVMVTLATGLVYLLMGRPGASFWNYLLVSWKFPSIATIAFGTAFQIYVVTKCRLELRNRELQRTVESDTAQRELQREELQRAREIQQALLPKEIPQIAGFEIAGTWEPARIVSGDYFDVIRLSETKLGICIADVVGKGVPAALFMANVQASVRAHASECAAPAWLCERVNSMVCANITAEKFVTLFYGVLDGDAKTFQYASAGHPRPILWNALSQVTLLDEGGAVLGVFPEWKYQDSVVQLAPGDRLVLYTDGLTEAENAEGEQFGEEGLMYMLKKLAEESPSRLNAELLTDVKSFSGSHLRDDATLITIAVAATANNSGLDNASTVAAASSRGSR